jgi:hypothetical protein
VPQEETSIFWVVIISAILSKEVYLYICPIPERFQLIWWIIASRNVFLHISYEFLVPSTDFSEGGIKYRTFYPSISSVHAQNYSVMKKSPHYEWTEAWLVQGCGMCPTTEESGFDSRQRKEIFPHVVQIGPGTQITSGPMGSGAFFRR